MRKRIAARTTYWQIRKSNQNVDMPLTPSDWMYSSPTRALLSSPSAAADTQRPAPTSEYNFTDVSAVGFVKARHFGGEGLNGGKAERSDTRHAGGFARGRSNGAARDGPANFLRRNDFTKRRRQRQRLSGRRVSGPFSGRGFPGNAETGVRKKFDTRP